MSIAELIMQGTNRASESTSWVGNSLAQLGQQVGASLAQKEQQKQAQAMLPMLQQNLQESMSLAQQGQSGAAYSKMLGTLDPQTLNNPQLMPFVKLGFDAIGKSADDYLYSQKVAQGTSGMDSILPLLALSNPKLAEQLAASRTQTRTTAQPAIVTPPTKTMGAGGTAVADFDTPVDAVDLPTNPQAAPQDSGLTAPVGTPQKAPSPTQAKVAKGFEAVKQQLNSGTPFSSVMSESTKMIFPKDTVQPFSQGFIAMPRLGKYIPGAEGMTRLDKPEVLKQKGMNISSRSGMSLSFENIPDPSYNYQQGNKSFSERVNEAISTLDSDSGLQKAIKALGGFDKISFGTDRQGIFIEIPKGNISEKVRIPKETREAAVYIAGVPQAAKDAFMPLYGTEIDMPAASAVGAGRSKENLANILK
jgi:hypothetical protein